MLLAGNSSNTLTGGGCRVCHASPQTPRHGVEHGKCFIEGVITDLVAVPTQTFAILSEKCRKKGSRFVRYWVDMQLPGSTGIRPPPAGHLRASECGLFRQLLQLYLSLMLPCASSPKLFSVFAATILGPFIILSRIERKWLPPT